MGTFNSEGFIKRIYSAGSNPCPLQNRVLDRSQHPLSVEKIIEELKKIKVDDHQALQEWAKKTIEDFESQKKATRAYQGA
jgi:hypothetical protein